jgi:hypothetical protein
LVGDDLLQAFDAVAGEGSHAIFADAVDAKAAVFGEHVDRQPSFVGVGKRWWLNTPRRCRKGMLG